MFDYSLTVTSLHDVEERGEGLVVFNGARILELDNFTVGGSKYLSEKARRRWGLNFTSIRSVPRVIDYKVARQVMVFEQDGVVENETRSLDFGFEWNKTLPKRDKEAKEVHA